VIKDRKKMLKEFIFSPDRVEIYQKRKCAECLLENKRLGWQKLVEGFNNKTSSQQYSLSLGISGEIKKSPLPLLKSSLRHHLKQ